MNYLTNLDIIESFRLWRYWLYRGVVSYRLRYRKSSIGMLWPSLSLMVITVVLGAVWGTLLNKDSVSGYFLYLLCGYPVWSLLSGAMEQGSRELGLRTSGGVPFLTIILERIVMNWLPFLYMLPLVVLGVLFFHQGSYAHILYLPVFLVLIWFWIIGVISLLVVLISIFPDLKHLVNALMRLAFLATPIIWELPRLGDYQQYIWVNPFFIPLESLRYSLSGIIHQESVLWLFPLYSLVLFIVGVFVLNSRLRKLKG